LKLRSGKRVVCQSQPQDDIGTSALFATFLKEGGDVGHNIIDLDLPVIDVKRQYNSDRGCSGSETDPMQNDEHPNLSL